MAQLFAKDGGRWTKVAAGGSGGFRCPTSGVVSRFAQVRCAALRCGCLVRCVRQEEGFMTWSVLGVLLHSWHLLLQRLSSLLPCGALACDLAG